MTWLFAAYAVIWIAFSLYVFGLARRQKAVANEITALKQRLDSE